LRKLKDQWNQRIERPKNYGQKKNWSAVGAEQILERVSEHFQSDLERLKERSIRNNLARRCAITLFWDHAGLSHDEIAALSPKLCSVALSSRATRTPGHQGAALAGPTRVKIVDGAGLSMPDTAANQLEWPQNSGQRPGCGFPQLKVVGLFCLQSGALLEVAHDNKHHNDIMLARRFWHLLQPGEILLADRGFGIACSSGLTGSPRVGDFGRAPTCSLALRTPLRQSLL
jgi:hypothetical protein